MNGWSYVGLGMLAAGAGTAAYLWWQSSIRPHPYEEMFEVVQDDLVQKRNLRLTSGGALEIEGRMIPLEGAVNFRDLGGYRTANGRRIAWGRLYRAGELYGLTDHDRALIQELGIRVVCDLRSTSEVQHRPDHLPEGINSYHLPIFSKDPIGRRNIIFMRHRLDPVFKRMYRDSIIDRGAPALGGLLKLVADPMNLPLLFHCVGGKDRTGIAAALLLHLCGVPRATIITDYTQTNLSIERTFTEVRRSMKKVRQPPGLRLEQLYPLFSARAELIEHAFEHIEATYGSPDNYLLGPVGLTAADIEAIRDNLLEPI